MTQFINNTSIHKGTHLTETERGQIKAMIELNLSNRETARRLNHAPQTINNEVKPMIKTLEE